jgi:hypothetical protein
LAGVHQLVWLQWMANAALFAGCFTACFFLLKAVPRRRRRWPAFALKRWTDRNKYPAWSLKLFGIQAGGDSVLFKERLLLQAGLRVDPVLYEMGRRFVIGCAMAVFLYGAIAANRPLLHLFGEPVLLAFAGAAMILIGGCDRVWLEALGKLRAQKIMKEVYIISNQLLYYTGSKLSLHAKLVRCVPFAGLIRPELQLLLNEWYADPEQALRTFKRRLGTEEAYSFAETINSLRLNEHASYYALLKERIRDYKEKLELARESRKETNSYLLFVLAGIPILNTFRIFVYPWVMEGQKLFDALQ